MKLDNIHWKRNKLLSFKKVFNYAISPREPGKSTQLWDLALNLWKKGSCMVVLRRMTSDITNAYLDSIEAIYTKFEAGVEITYDKHDMAKGIVDVLAKGPKDEKPRILARILALSAPMQRLKSLVLLNLKYMCFDEFICDTLNGEKYLCNEVFKFKEIYNTYQRECKKLRVIFFGNPYSIFNPYFMWKKIPIKQVKPGALLTGEDWALEVIQLTEELKRYILKHNPLYKFDDAYTKYAFNGEAINDANIRIVDKQPNEYSLKFIFKYSDSLIGAFVWSPSNESIANITQHYQDNEAIDYWVCTLPQSYHSERRAIMAFNISDMVEGTYLIGAQERKLFEGLATAFRFRRIGFQNVGDSYAIQSIINL